MKNGCAFASSFGSGNGLAVTKKLMAELFQKAVRTSNGHIKNIFEENKLSTDLIIQKFRITAAAGKNYEVPHYNLDVIVS